MREQNKKSSYLADIYFNKGLQELANASDTSAFYGTRSLNNNIAAVALHLSNLYF